MSDLEKQIKTGNQLFQEFLKQKMPTVEQRKILAKQWIPFEVAQKEIEHASLQFSKELVDKQEKIANIEHDLVEFIDKNRL